QLCDGACVETDVDPDNCGHCGNACDATEETCSAGACVKLCGDGALSRCGDACVDTETDAANCGHCGNACAGGEQCVAGACVTPEAPKGVYTMSNDASGNAILAFARAADGTLTAAGTFAATGGKGTGAGLGNQHGLVFDANLGRLFAVNAGDDSISMLKLELDGTLTLESNVPSGGVHPVSITSHGDVVYVVNAGNAASVAPGNIAGFKVQGDALVPIDGSTKPLGAANPAPAQIQFTPDGSALVVAEKGTNALDAYTVAADVASGPVTTASAGQTPFGFDFTPDGHLVVSEAWGGMAGQSSVSSYSIDASGALTAVTPALPTTRTAACWLVVSNGFAFVANAQTNDITGLAVAADGGLSLLDPSGVAGQAGMAPVDEDVTDDGAFLYVVDNGSHALSVFAIGADGSLTKKPDFVGIPSTASGIVAR
ncbi:MAG TPA: beta-propeller fold lactonase family protein, partial [Minicystis sp.]|nr:beta-propeller fold lactonase family protein [Minicystis sp.]